jgi:hypothetical protein
MFVKTQLMKKTICLFIFLHSQIFGQSPVIFDKQQYGADSVNFELNASKVVFANNCNIRVLKGIKFQVITDTLVLGNSGKIDGTGSIGGKGKKGTSPEWDNKGTNCNHQDWENAGGAPNDRGHKGGKGLRGTKGATVLIFYKVLIGNNMNFKIFTNGGEGGPGGAGGDGAKLTCCHCGQSKIAPQPGGTGDKGEMGPQGSSLMRPYVGLADIQQYIK